MLIRRRRRPCLFLFPEYGWVFGVAERSGRFGPHTTQLVFFFFHSETLNQRNTLISHRATLYPGDAAHAVGGLGRRVPGLTGGRNTQYLLVVRTPRGACCGYCVDNGHPGRGSAPEWGCSDGSEQGQDCRFTLGRMRCGDPPASCGLLQRSAKCAGCGLRAPAGGHLDKSPGGGGGDLDTCSSPSPLRVPPPITVSQSAQ